MGSPQPPLIMPQSTLFAPVAASSFDTLPLDVKYILLQQIDSFATLHSLEKALGAEVEEVVEGFRRGVHSAIAQTEFAPVKDAVMAIRMLDMAAIATTGTATTAESDLEIPATDKTIEKNTVPKLVEQLNATVDTGAGLLDIFGTQHKLHTLNVAALGLAELYTEYKGRTLSTVELFRFKQAVFRCATFFELYKESKAIKGTQAPPSPQTVNNDEEEEEDEEAQEEDAGDEEAKEKSRFRPRNTFLSTLPHQDVLEMDCVREFMHELAEGIARLMEDGEDEDEEEDDNEQTTTTTTTICQDQLTSILSEFGFGLNPTHPSCSCSPTVSSHNHNDINDLNEPNETNTTNSNTCTLQTPHLADGLLLLGPIALLRLLALTRSQPKQIALLKAIIHTLVPNPNRKRDIFWDEIMPFWRGLRKVYDFCDGESEEVRLGKQRMMPRGCGSVMEVMGVGKYEFAVCERGRVFGRG